MNPREPVGIYLEIGVLQICGKFKNSTVITEDKKTVDSFQEHSRRPTDFQLLHVYERLVKGVSFINSLIAFTQINKCCL